MHSASDARWDYDNRARKALTELGSCIKKLQMLKQPPVLPSAASSTSSSSTTTTPPTLVLSQLVGFTQSHPRFQSLYINSLGHFPRVRPDYHESAPDAIFALDCEMIATASDDMALARVSLVQASSPLTPDSNFTPVLDLVVNPLASKDSSYILDTRESITSLTREDVISRGVPLASAQQQVLALLNAARGNVVIVGHAVEHDLAALRLNVERVVDTALLFTVPGSDTHTHSLASLSEAILGTAALQGRADRQGRHDSVEDATLTLRIVAALVARWDRQVNDYPLVLPRTSNKLAAKTVTERGDAGALRARQVDVSKQLTRLAFG